MDYRPSGLNISYYLYLAQCENGYLKIGISSCTEKRMEALGDVWKLSVVLIADFPSYHIVERRLHESLSEYRIKGEWYRNDPRVFEAFAAATGARMEDIGPVDGSRFVRRRPARKLNEHQVREIRRRAALGEKSSSIAADFEVGRANVVMIVTRQSWRHLS